MSTAHSSNPPPSSSSTSPPTDHGSGGDMELSVYQRNRAMSTPGSIKYQEQRRVSELLDIDIINVKRKQSVAFDEEFDEAIKAYLERDKRRRSTLVKSDPTIVDFARTQWNIKVIIFIILGVMGLVVLGSLYWRRMEWGL